MQLFLTLTSLPPGSAAGAGTAAPSERCVGRKALLQRCSGWWSRDCSRSQSLCGFKGHVIKVLRDAGTGLLALRAPCRGKGHVMLSEMLMKLPVSKCKLSSLSLSEVGLSSEQLGRFIFHLPTL